MPNVSCITAADGTLLCNNNVACASSSNFSSTFLLTQTGTTIVDERQLVVAGEIVSQTNTATANPSATPPPSAMALAAKSTTSHARPSALVERQIENPVHISQVISDIFTSTSPSDYFSKLFQQTAENLCVNTVESLLKTLSGPATETVIQTMTADLVDACIVALDTILTVDPPLELLAFFAGSIMCKTLVNTIVSLPFNPITSVACEAVHSMTSPPTTAGPTPSNTSNYCTNIICYGDCNDGVSPFQGVSLTTSCACPGGLSCDCTSSNGTGGLPVCYDVGWVNVVPIDGGSGCGTCNCPAILGPPDPTGISGSCECACNLCSNNVC